MYSDGALKNTFTYIYQNVSIFSDEEYICENEVDVRP